ncbi:S8 family serine peptidase [Myxococcota bacterium]|nr:S8 family serine peptidase [Myxococcota bacterium]MBU1381047.1 S8 family serine peptidase [Myxococcota bacterium]MBU1495426.1 S8 family serine peptidase [Myxococcota bacterium]
MRFVFFISLFLFFFACETERKSRGLFDDYVPSDNYYKDVDSESIISDESGIYPVNQFLFVLSDEVPEEDLSEIAASVATKSGGLLVGEIKQIRLYQVELSTSTVPELVNSINLAKSEVYVTDAFENIIFLPDGKTSNCKDRDSELYKNVPQTNRTPFEFTDVYGMLGIIKNSTTFSKVKLASAEYVADRCGQFDSVEKKYAKNWKPAPVADKLSMYEEDLIAHGIATMSIIVSDTGDGAIEGIASVAIGSKNIGLFLRPYTANDPDFASTMHFYLEACDCAKVDIINSSLSSSLMKKEQKFTPEKIAKYINRFKRVLDLCPDTLFVSTAGNEWTELMPDTAVPAGIQADNHITVGGLGKKKEQDNSIDYNKLYYMGWSDNKERMVGTNWGNLVDIYAPAVNIPTLWGRSDGYCEDTKYFNDGTSYAAPQVTALAVILKSINKGLKPKEIKKLIVESGGVLIDNKVYPSLKFSPPVAQALLDISAVDADKFDADHDAIADPVSLILHRICGESYLKIEKIDEWSFSSDQQDLFADFRENVFSIGTFLGNNSMSMYDLAVSTFSPYPHLGRKYFWDEENNIATFEIISNDGATMESFGVTMKGSGSVIFRECEILERNPLNDTPMSVSLTGDAYGSMLVDKNNSRFKSKMTLTFKVDAITLYANPVFLQELEQICYFGYGSGDYSTHGECGDNHISVSQGEICDGDNFGELTCSSVNPQFGSGKLTCINCTQVDTSQCIPVLVPEVSIETTDLPFVINNDFCTAGYSDIYSPGFEFSCTGGEAQGSEHIYGITLAPSQSITTTFTSEYDNVIYVLGDYADPNAQTCITGVDDSSAEPFIESLSLTNDSSELKTYYVVFDHINATCEEFTNIPYSIRID